MKKVWLVGIMVILVLIGVVFLLIDQKEERVPGYCDSDSDCVPASCCHPDSCVVKEQAPNCDGILCSQSCEEGTLDCGQGNCACENNQCEAKLNK